MGWQRRIWAAADCALVAIGASILLVAEHLGSGAQKECRKAIVFKYMKTT